MLVYWLGGHGSVARRRGTHPSGALNPALTVLAALAIAAVASTAPAIAFAGAAPAVSAPATLGPDKDLTTLGRYPFGVCYHCSAWGDTVAWGRGPVLEITDFSDPAAPRILGQLELEHVIVSVCAVPGRAYAYCFETGLFIVDTSDPAAPHVRGVYPSVTRMWGMAPLGRYLLIGNAGSGLLVLDVDDPAHPVAAGSYPVAGASARGVSLDGDLAYVSFGSKGLRVLDVSTPYAPAEVGRLEGFVAGYGLDKSGDFVFVPTLPDSFCVVDVSDPVTPKMRGRVKGLVNPGYLVHRDSRVFLSTFPRGVGVIDVTDPDAPSLVATFAGPWPESVCLGRSWLFVPAGGGGLVAVDITDPAAPVEVGRRDDCGYGVGMAVVGSRAYLASRYDGLRVLDASDPARLRLLGQVPAYLAYAVAVRAGYAYVAATDAGCLVVDVQDPAAPRTVAVLEGWWADGVALDGRYLYVSDGSYGLRIFDVDDPTAPVAVSQLVLPRYKHDVTVRGGYAYVAAGSDGVRVVDARDPAAPVLVATVATGGYCAQISSEGDLVAAAAGSGGLVLLDLTNPALPTVAGVVDALSAISGAALSQGRAYVADEAYGLYAYDITQPQRPLLRASLPLRGAQRVAVAGQQVWITVMEDGVTVVRDDALTPNTLAAFHAERARGGARLAWSFAPLAAPKRVHVYRQEPDRERVRLTSAPLEGVEAGQFWDGQAPAGAADYWLLALGDGGAEQWHGPAHLPAAPVPAALRLDQNRPNPFNPRTTLALALPQAGRTTLVVYDARGRRVATLLDAVLPAGEREVVWDGRDGVGRALPSGEYVARLETPGGRRSIKLTLAR